MSIEQYRTSVCVVAPLIPANARSWQVSQWGSLTPISKTYCTRIEGVRIIIQSKRGHPWRNALSKEKRKVETIVSDDVAEKKKKNNKKKNGNPFVRRTRSLSLPRKKLRLIITKKNFQILFFVRFCFFSLSSKLI